jgi:hypothetical protein
MVSRTWGTEQRVLRSPTVANGGDEPQVNEQMAGPAMLM